MRALQSPAEGVLLPRSLEGLARAVERLDVQIAGVVEELNGVREEVLVRLRLQTLAAPAGPQQREGAQRPAQVPVLPAPQPPQIQAVSRWQASRTGCASTVQEFGDLAGCVEDLGDRLSRLELLLFRLPEPDFQKLDTAIEELLMKGGRQGGDAPMATLLEEEDEMPSPRSPRAAGLVQLPARKQELGIFSDDDDFDSFRSKQGGCGTHGGSGTVTDGEDGEASVDAPPDFLDAAALASGSMAEHPVCMVFNMAAGDKKDEAEDSDPEKPKLRAARAGAGRIILGSAAKLPRSLPRRPPDEDEEEDSW